MASQICDAYAFSKCSRINQVRGKTQKVGAVMASGLCLKTNFWLDKSIKKKANGGDPFAFCRHER